MFEREISLKYPSGGHNSYHNSSFTAKYYKWHDRLQSKSLYVSLTVTGERERETENEKLDS